MVFQRGFHQDLIFHNTGYFSSEASPLNQTRHCSVVLRAVEGTPNNAIATILIMVIDCQHLASG